jgi:hypothetical protein
MRERMREREKSLSFCVGLTKPQQHPKVKTMQVEHSRGKRCGDIELEAYLADTAGAINFVTDLHITHERWGSTVVSQFLVLNVTT